jgi:hypothetical protein
MAPELLVEMMALKPKGVEMVGGSGGFPGKVVVAAGVTVSEYAPVLAL